jgi:hypothetical protein
MNFFRFSAIAIIAVILAAPASLQAQCNWLTGDSTKTTLPANCVAGIGTSAAPDAPLTVQSGTGDVISLRDNAATPTTRFRLYAHHSSYYFDLNATNYDLRFSTATAGGSGGNIAFFTNSSGTATERMRILPNGNVGIGLTAPVSLFEVTKGWAPTPSASAATA